MMLDHQYSTPYSVLEMNDFLLLEVQIRFAPLLGCFITIAILGGPVGDGFTQTKGLVAVQFAETAIAANVI
jgi:hypothetical protein